MNDAFHETGVVVVRGAFDLEWIDRLAAGVERNRRAPSAYGCRYTKAGDPGDFWDDYCSWERIPEYREFIFESGVAGLVGGLLESGSVRIFHEHVLVKEAGTREVSPWHHDQPYYCVDGEQVCSVWTPLDPVPRAACPEFVAGSHRWGKLFAPRKFLDHEPYQDALRALEPVPDIDAHREDYEILSWDLALGDVVVFHMKTVHGAPGTAKSATRRRAVATRWLGDDAVFARRTFTTSPPFDDLALAPGDPMDDPRFPVVWTAGEARASGRVGQGGPSTGPSR